MWFFGVLTNPIRYIDQTGLIYGYVSPNDSAGEAKIQKMAEYGEWYRAKQMEESLMKGAEGKIQVNEWMTVYTSPTVNTTNTGITTRYISNDFDFNTYNDNRKGKGKNWWVFENQKDITKSLFSIFPKAAIFDIVEQKRR